MNKAMVLILFVASIYSGGCRHNEAVPTASENPRNPTVNGKVRFGGHLGTGGPQEVFYFCVESIITINGDGVTTVLELPQLTEVFVTEERGPVFASLNLRIDTEILQLQLSTQCAAPEYPISLAYGEPAYTGVLSFSLVRLLLTFNIGGTIVPKGQKPPSSGMIELDLDAMAQLEFIQENMSLVTTSYIPEGIQKIQGGLTIRPIEPAPILNN